MAADRGRIEELSAGHASPEQYLVPGARALLESLNDRGLKMYLASGTDEIYMKEEARLLDVARYFDGGVYGALDDYKSFSKKILIQRILSTTDVRGEEILGFGDGYVEIEEVKNGGRRRGGRGDHRTRVPGRSTIGSASGLIGVGADYIVPNYLGHEELMRALFNGRPVQSYETFDRSRLTGPSPGGRGETISSRTLARTGGSCAGVRSAGSSGHRRAPAVGKRSQAPHEFS